ncbi:MAG: hypothetical protein IT359_13405 [Gemmatimonadaceae bacterium]|nr:hypothetical protein [Gemmatimonadaceae bacterium]
MPIIPTPSSRQAPAPYTEESYVPVATRRTRALRTFLPWQLLRFIAINLKMLRMIAKSHQH